VYQNGFVYSHKSNLTIFRWSEITSITAVATNFRALGFIPAGKVREYWIAKANTKLRLASTLDEVDNLLADIRKNSFPHMYDRIKQELDDGKTIEFGLVTIDKNGVKSGGKEYLWLDLAQAGLANGKVYYVPKKPNVISGIHVTTQHVPNFDVLLALSNDLIRQTGQPS
jgi:hypothetical protein